MSDPDPVLDGPWDYGAFTLLMQYYTEPELLFTVPNICFMPPPGKSVRPQEPANRVSPQNTAPGIR